MLAGYWSITSVVHGQGRFILAEFFENLAADQGGLGGDGLGRILFQHLVERGGGLGQLARLELAPSQPELSFDLVLAESPSAASRLDNSADQAASLAS